VLVLAAVALIMAFADDKKASPGNDLSLIVEEDPAAPGAGGSNGEVPLDDIRDGVYPDPGTVFPTEPDGGIGGPIGRLPPDAPVTNTPREPRIPSQPAEPTPGLAPLPAGSQRVLAPIDGADMLVLESFPPQYMLHVKAGLPSGCAKPGGYEMNRSGDTIRVSVYNTMPTGNPICTQIYGMYELNIALGSDFEPGKTYTVLVNDRRLTITAQ
jgi:hypothetical protein